MKKQTIKDECIKTLLIKMDDVTRCFEGEVIINGVKPHKGIATIDLHLKANEKPQVIVFGMPRHIPKKIKEAWGLKDDAWEEAPYKSMPKLTKKEQLSLDRSLKELDKAD